VELGVQPGDRGAVQVDKSPETVMLYLAVLRVGAVYLPLNSGYTGDELLQGPAVPVFASFFKALGASPNTRSRLDILAIAPTAAVVRVDMENDVLGASFHDFLSLLKIDGQWKIISKIFQRYA